MLLLRKLCHFQKSDKVAWDRKNISKCIFICPPRTFSFVFNHNFDYLFYLFRTYSYAGQFFLWKNYSFISKCKRNKVKIPLLILHFLPNNLLHCFPIPEFWVRSLLIFSHHLSFYITVITLFLVFSYREVFPYFWFSMSPFTIPSQVPYWPLTEMTKATILK